MDFISMTFEPTDRRPLYQQLYSWLAGEIAAGRLQAGERLPSKRSAAANLGVSLNTVETALGMLIAEGYLESRPRSGVFVADVAPLIPAPHTPAPPDQAAAKSGWDYSFPTSGVDVSLFPQKVWARIARDVNAGAPALLNHGPAEGEAALRAQSVSPAQVAAWNEAFSYDAGRTARQTRDQETPLSREEEERVIQRVLKDLNYNRMADEVLDRVERRLRTERRKIGR